MTVSLSWNPYLPDWRAMQMIDRNGDDGEDTPDLLRDWTGTDARSSGDPLTVSVVYPYQFMVINQFATSLGANLDLTAQTVMFLE